MDKNEFTVCLLVTSQPVISPVTVNPTWPQSGIAACGIRTELPSVGKR